MNVRTLTSELLGSHCYLLIDGDHCTVIDPGDKGLIDPVITEEQLTVDQVILTHEHCDHVYGLSDVKEKYHCPVIASEKCNDNLKDSRKNFSQYYNAFLGVQNRYDTDAQKEIEPFTTSADEVFEGEKTIEWRGHHIYMRETPGHSPGSICIVVDDEILFSGDTLMGEDVTETNFIGGSAEDLREKTMPWLESLPGCLKVYAGHGDSFVLGNRLNDKEI